MKSEAELKEWIQKRATNTGYIPQESVRSLFTGMQLVPAGAVVLSVEDAELLLRFFPKTDKSEHMKFAVTQRAAIAIDLARGK